MQATSSGVAGRRTFRHQNGGRSSISGCVSPKRSGRFKLSLSGGRNQSFFGAGADTTAAVLRPPAAPATASSAAARVEVPSWICPTASSVPLAAVDSRLDTRCKVEVEDCAASCDDIFDSRFCSLIGLEQEPELELWTPLEPLPASLWLVTLSMLLGGGLPLAETTAAPLPAAELCIGGDSCDSAASAAGFGTLDTFDDKAGARPTPSPLAPLFVLIWRRIVSKWRLSCTCSCRLRMKAWLGTSYR
mmetsp:Transcript_38137/g.89417  ORF Transcript_38137/g.89417 Transcript_38137/m.89417 type:complete len:246 (-) Transcript_38137:638-1375(-)